MRFIFNLLIVLFVSFSLILLTSPASAILPGDANGDGLVDGPDYVIWLNHYNQSATGAANGDFDNSGKVDGLDYVIWLTNYQSTAPTATPTLGSPPPAGNGMWISKAELAALPTSGTAWDQMRSTAYGSWGTPDLKNQDNK